MSINLLFTQIPLVGEISGAMQAAPEVQQSIMNQAANEVSGQQREQVQKNEKQDGADVVDAHGGGGGAQAETEQERKRRKKQPAKEEAEEALAKTPFMGNLINTRI